MKIVAIGGAGRIGSLLVACLKRLGHEAVPAPPERGQPLTGEGLSEVLVGAQWPPLRSMEPSKSRGLRPSPSTGSANT
jgi:hypothetical protein